MGVDWVTDLLVLPGTITDVLLFDALVASREAGLGERGFIHGVSAEGMETFVFDDLRTAAEWVSGGIGLSLTLRATDSELSLSVVRRDGDAHPRLSMAPDRPLFDEVVLSCSMLRLCDEREQVWRPFTAVLRNLAARLPVVYGYAFTETAGERLVAYQCVHSRVSQGRMPPFVGWLTMAPRSSTIAGELYAAAPVVDATVTEFDRYVVLELGPNPWSTPEQDVLARNRRWRSVTGDRGCLPVPGRNGSS